MTYHAEADLRHFPRWRCKFQSKRKTRETGISSDTFFPIFCSKIVVLREYHKYCQTSSTFKLGLGRGSHYVRSVESNRCWCDEENLRDHRLQTILFSGQNDFAFFTFTKPIKVSKMALRKPRQWFLTSTQFQILLEKISGTIVRQTRNPCFFPNLKSKLNITHRSTHVAPLKLRAFFLSDSGKSLIPHFNSLPTLWQTEWTKFGTRVKVNIRGPRSQKLLEMEMSLPFPFHSAAFRSSSSHPLLHEPSSSFQAPKELSPALRS